MYTKVECSGAQLSMSGDVFKTMSGLKGKQSSQHECRVYRAEHITILRPELASSNTEEKIFRKKEPEQARI